MKKFENKVVLITGGARGMGKIHAEEFIKEGAIVYFTDILASEGVEVEKQLGKNAHFVKQDVASEKDWHSVYDIIEKNEGKLDILINNAGIVTYKPIGEMSLSEYMRVINVNQVSVFLGMSVMLNLLKKAKDSSVVNISSVAGLRTAQNSVAYSSSKFAVRALGEVGALEFAKYNIRVNTICPGAVETPMLVQEDTKDSVLRFAQRIPLKRIAKPIELTKAVMFLCSSDSSYMTGSTIVVDGGSILSL